MKKYIAFLGICCVGSCLFAGEWTPQSVWTSAETYATPPGRYAIDKICDGDWGTYACLLDDSRNGKNPKVCPPNANSPVTATFVMDLGAKKSVRGVRFVSRNSWALVSPENVSLFACDDAEGKTGVRPLKENVELLRVTCSNSAFVVLDQAVETRYVGVRVNQAFQRELSYHWKWQQLEWCRRLGLAIAGDGANYNVQIAEVTCFDEIPADLPKKNADNVAFPEERLQRDWLYQDCGLDISRAFFSKTDNAYEKAMVEKVLAEYRGSGADGFRATLDGLIQGKVPGNDPRWRELYFQACAKRRIQRLAYVRSRATQFLYVKHHIFGSTNGIVGKYDQPDEQIRDYTASHKPGSQLCLATIHEDGTISQEVLIDKPNGTICYPTLSYDARTLVFSMRDNYETDAYSLYTMDMATKKVTRITFPIVRDGKTWYVSDCEPCFLPNGKIVFTSTRSVHISDCWYRSAGDIYTCDVDGKNIQRLTYDQLMTNLPQVLEDGRIVFTRWEYNDRSALYNHPLIVMNPDGTVQTEYYGNNSLFPSSILHANRIPGSSKIIATISGHHTIYKGKLGIIDQSRGMQGDAGIEFVNMKLNGQPGREQADVKPAGIEDFCIDIFGQVGPQYAHPYAFDEENYLASFSPEGAMLTFGPLNAPFGAYYMTADGKRELLAYDIWQGTGRIVPVMETPMPPDRGNHVLLDDNFGTYYLQNVYFGPGLTGIAPGTVKKLRVVALEYRVCRMGYGQNGGECETGLCQTPISLNSGSWDVKHVIGEVDVEEDGSCYFRVPARTPVYFQLLDANGYVVQSMRSWSTLMNGEQFACLGCHENKNDVLPASQRRATLAMRKPIQTPRRVDGSLHPLVARYEKESWRENVENYLGVNVPRSLDAKAPVEGFSYEQEIQPILERHCVKCHFEGEKGVAPSLTGEVARPETIQLIGAGRVDPKRAYTQSYVNLTTSGNPDGNPWMDWLKPRSRATMLPPYHKGSAKSKIMKFFEPEHYDVQVSDVEKRTFACWIDLLVPFCGSYPQANTWTDAEKTEYQYYQDKRRLYAEEELETLRK
ncbi:MAG: hypothetical protein Q4D98_08105 [Planctomycetia bacterium]|nr:hypothetical protein [Planctomycetia bacterium]